MSKCCHADPVFRRHARPSATPPEAVNRMQQQAIGFSPPFCYPMADLVQRFTSGAVMARNRCRIFGPMDSHLGFMGPGTEFVGGTRMNDLERLCINTIRFLSADAVEHAHAGTPRHADGSGPMGHTLWTSFSKHNP